ncbi:MAG: hypothetical protein EOS52_14900 [Mesorhizobium sp.]|uniref:hypothetical protein n=1 Tax=Mesorhizobium sp. TaxID=1871066 RepID=UPI000FE6EB26|nr:hypothetical protein [Mesorhizobium sp.]RWC13773.1 MAG: hypothetical protein EOS52_14900 [Mesorhizobium sp.]
MSDDAYQRKTAAFAAMLVKQAAWPAAIVIAGDSIAPLVVLGFSALLVFDALLFRLMATHGDEISGGAAVDDMLARMRLKPAPATPRPLDDRIAGTRRLLARQRIAFAVFVVAFLTAGFWMPR